VSSAGNENMVTRQNCSSLLCFSFCVVLDGAVHFRYELRLHWAAHRDSRHSRFVWNAVQWAKRRKLADVSVWP